MVLWGSPHRLVRERLGHVESRQSDSWSLVVPKICSVSEVLSDSILSAESKSLRS